VWLLPPTRSDVPMRVCRWRRSTRWSKSPRRLQLASPFNPLWAYGEARAFGFSPFGIDSLATAAGASAPKPSIGDTYRALDELSDLLLHAQRKNESRGLVLDASSPRATQTVSLGGYLFEATLLRSWPARNLLTNYEAMIILQSKPNEFLVNGP
jgi:hypothetical protein